MTSRTTRPANATVDGVGIIAIIDTEQGPRIVLQKQFRPPVEGVCIEIPAGLIDPNESVETCALRELKEETGYFGTHVSTTSVMFNDPGFTNTNLVMVTVKIDLNDARNKTPVPQLEDNEFIDTFTVPLKELPLELDLLASQGYKLDARLACVAHGLSVAAQFFAN